MRQAETIIVGAGPGGLACAAALRSAGRSAIVLEKADCVGSSWHRHYERLHLHTDRNHSGLPGLPMPPSYPKYPSRKEVIAYLEGYAEHHKIEPRFGTEVLRIDQDNDDWTVEAGGSTFSAQNVIIAVGTAAWPRRGAWPGKESFTGRIVHSSDYVNAAPFEGAKVLVVGFGNSGAEIAMELADAGNAVAVSLRSPANIVPRDLLGLPIVQWSIWQQHLPYRAVDFVNMRIAQLRVGDLTKFGLPRPTKGPIAQVKEDHKIPVIDIGAVDRIKRGKIAVRPGIAHIEGERVHFSGGTVEPYDVIVEATGFAPDLRAMLPNHRRALDASGAPRIGGVATDYRGLFLCGHVPVSTGQLRQLGIQARRIAGLIAARVIEARAA